MDKPLRIAVAPHPGTLLAEYIEAAGMTQAELADRLGHSRKHVNRIVRGHASIEAPLALKLERVLGRPAMFWLRLQAQYDEARARAAK